MCASSWAVGASSSWSEAPLDGFHGLWLLAIVCGSFCLGAEVKDLGPTLRAFALGMAISVPFEVAQVFGWERIPQTAVPGGLFYQTNVLADALALAIVASAHRRSWLLMGWLAFGTTSCAAPP